MIGLVSEIDDGIQLLTVVMGWKNSDDFSSRPAENPEDLY
jgi:hypothetical protein